MKIMEVKRNSPARNNFRSVNSIILKFPMFREGLKEVKGVFEQCGEYTFLHVWSRYSICELKVL